ncbi:unnamed protein product [Schistosoma turkestanicum]|nr:unnamed protein product [Schistosoma turkestanicum]
MINIYPYLVSKINCIFYAWIICIHINCFIRPINEQHLSEQDYSQNTNHVDDSNNLIGCTDSDGIWHGLFSTWMENPTCWCTCQPVSRMAVSVCDGCDISKSANNNIINLDVKHHHNNSDKNLLKNESLLEVSNSFDTFKTNGNEINQKRSVDNYHEHKTFARNSNSCYYAVTNTYYQHKDIWMSAELPCVKCKCQHGNVHCVGEPHQCPSVCLPGQYSQPVGPCCHTVCKGTVSKDITFEFASCLKTGDDTLHSHGEMITLTGICVDQKCQCVNGRWNCFDYCTPLSELSCPSDEKIIWDPFCCPRCRGDQTCSVIIDMKNWLSNPNEQTNNVNTFKKLDWNSTHWSQSSFNNQPEQLLLEPISNVNSNVNKEIITIQPGQQIVLEQGHCFCLNASIYCPRPGRLIWHEDDCFYMDGQEISYHAVGTRWIPGDDHCTECMCEINRTYRCKRQSCQQLFLCPPEQIPMTSEDECCPSYCAPPSQKNQEKPNNFNQDIQYNDELYTDSVKSQNKMVQISMDETTQQKPSQLSTRNTGCSSLIDNENILQYPDVFPSGSRLLLIRTCRSLLCICAKDNRWVCTDHCPPCEQSMESIENLRQILLPPKDKCCELCNEKTNTVHITSPLSQNKLKSQKEIMIQTSNQTNLQHLTNEQTHKEYISTEIKQLKLTLKMYILIFSIILICMFGLPISILIGCYLMKSRYFYQNHHHHHPHQNKRKSDHYQYTTTTVATPKTTRSRYRHYYHRCYSRVKPYLLKSHDYKKDQSELEASIETPISASTTSSLSSMSPSSSPVLILRESYRKNNRRNYNAASMPSTTKITKVSEDKCNPKSIQQHYRHHQTKHVNANKQENTTVNSDDTKLVQHTSITPKVKLNELVNSGDYYNSTVSHKNHDSKSHSLIKKFSDYIFPTMTTTAAKTTNSPVIIRLKTSNETNYPLKQQQPNVNTSLSMNDDSDNYNINNSENHQAIESKHVKDALLQQYEVKPIKARTTSASEDKTNCKSIMHQQRSPKEILLKNLILSTDINNKNKHTTYNNNNIHDNSSQCISHIKSEPSTPNIFMHNVTFNSYYSATCSSPCCSPSPIMVSNHNSSQDKTTTIAVLTMNNPNYENSNNNNNDNKQTNLIEQQKNKLNIVECDKIEATIVQENMISSQVVDNKLNNPLECNITKVNHEHDDNHASKVIEKTKQQTENLNYDHNQIICDKTSLNEEIYCTENKIDNMNNDDTSSIHLLTESNQNMPLYTYYYQHSENTNTTPRKQKICSDNNNNDNSRRPVTWPTIQHFTSDPILHR